MVVSPACYCSVGAQSACVVFASGDLCEDLCWRRRAYVGPDVPAACGAVGFDAAFGSAGAEGGEGVARSGVV